MKQLMTFLARFKFCVFIWKQYRRILDHTRTHRLGRLRRHNGFSTYTVVSAVYNVEKYLDDYFRTLAEQTLDFEKHIRLILVDDGSTDSSAAVIKKWQRRFPRNIAYVHKENGGQGSARNLGLELVKTPWVTFIDPDDFVDVNYFLRVDKFLRLHHRENNADDAIKMLSCNFIFFMEGARAYKDRHPLRERFTSAAAFRSIADLGDVIQMNVNNSFFPSALLLKSGLRFTESRWPTFEDGHFVLRYLLEQDAGRIAFSCLPKYYYRKRLDSSSSLDTSKQKKEYYIEQLRGGYLKIMEQYAREKGAVPLHVQYTVLYEISWRITQLCNAPPPAVLSPAEVDEFIALLQRIFAYVDSETIMNFPTAWSGMDFMHKAGMLALFKGELTPSVIVHAHQYDFAKNELCLVYHQPGVESEKILAGGQELRPTFAKSASISFCGRQFVLRRQLWVRLPPGAQRLEVRLGSRPVELSLGERITNDFFSIPAIREHFARGKDIPTASRAYADAWILMDRDTNADDNAEHLYRHIKKHAPEQRIFFALRSSSPDWPRLKAEGFNMLDFGTEQYEKILRGCSKIISSHADKYVTDYYKNMPLDKQFIFLQHGVTKDNLAAWFNSKKIDLFITCTPQEYASIVKDGSPYNDCAKTVVLTGFPRHDALMSGDLREEKIILVMPTWRQTLMGEPIPHTNARILNTAFMDTLYAKNWQSLLRSPRLRDMAEQAGHRILFSPHMNVQPYLPFFELPSHIEVLAAKDMRIQELFKKSKIMITDYSSVAFEMAMLQKAVLYYQFDRDEIFAGLHLTQKGYFDYERDGFGPVVLDEGVLLDALEAVLSNDGKPDTVYSERMDKTFPFRDGKNCERVLRAIRNLDEPFYLDDNMT